MGIYLLIGLFSLLLGLGILYWIYRIAKLYKKGNRKAFIINLLLLISISLFVSWELRILPISKTNDFKNKTEALTGKKFWSWNNYRYDELGVRGEGYTLEIYNLNQRMADYFKSPDKSFFEKFPTKDFATSTWQKTPVKQKDQELLFFVTPTYSGWGRKIVEKQKLIREIAINPGSYYAYGGNDFYLISPEEKLILWINHNM